MNQVVFGDRLVSAAVRSGLVGLDLAVFAGTARDKEGKPATQLELTHQLVMPLEAFAAAVARQDKVPKQLAAFEHRRRDAAAAVAQYTSADAIKRPSAIASRCRTHQVPCSRA